MGANHAEGIDKMKDDERALILFWQEFHINEYHGIPLQDSLIAVSFSKVEAMPWVRPESPAELVKLAREVRPTIQAKEAATFQEAIGEEVQNPASVKPQIVICGSLYLVADVIATLQSEAQWAC